MQMTTIRNNNKSIDFVAVCVKLAPTLPITFFFAHWLLGLIDEIDIDDNI